jgi:hypothetical protein
LRQHKTLVGFGVGPETKSASRRRRLHPLQILRHPRVINEDTRRPKVSKFHADSLNR